MQTGAVYIVDDDVDDHEMVNELWKELKLPNQLLFFTSGQDMLDHLTKVVNAPYIIICDVNLPKMNGFELREKLLELGSKKFTTVPFIFWSTHASDSQISKAYDLSAHGFFIKGDSFDKMKQSLKAILNYWTLSKMPTKH
jgi:DNA-binding NarL/FixJ family response regulator